MSIKSISKLDPFYNGFSDATDDRSVFKIGGTLRMFEDSGKSSEARDRDHATRKPLDHTEFHTTECEERYDNFYNSLFEISLPIDAGRDGINSLEFRSYKTTYKDIAKNLLMDMKNYLNVRNNLGEFNLCAMVFADYVYKGHKYFYPGNESGSDAGVDIKRSESDGYALSVLGKTNLDGNTDIYGNTYIGPGGNHPGNHWLKVYGGISGYGDLVINGILTANNDKVDITKRLSVGNLLFVYDLATFHDSVEIEQNLSVIGNTYLTGSMYGSNAYLTNEVSCKYLTADTKIYTPLLSATTIDAGIINCSGKLTANTIECNGLTCTAETALLTALAARWSDLAEYYLADDIYESGTLMQFGGDNEVTIARSEVNAAVTSKPALLMNAGLKDNPLGCALALAGRVPVKVIGKISKFDKIALSEIPGIARAMHSSSLRAIGRALEASEDEGIKLVECVVKFEV